VWAGNSGEVEKSARPPAPILSQINPVHASPIPLLENGSSRSGMGEAWTGLSWLRIGAGGELL
jgi:hypothetical protein